MSVLEEAFLSPGGQLRPFLAEQVGLSSQPSPCKKNGKWENCNS